jgi:arsenate reductase
MSDNSLNILFLCAGNSARSIFAEALINYWGRGKFKGYSAGSHPKGSVHPMALQLLDKLNFSTEGLHSKSWDDFAEPDSPVMDFVFTVCDKAAAEQCPVWPGQPMTAHWGVPDPVAVNGDEQEIMMAFRQAFRELENRIKIFVSLPFDSLDSLKLQKTLNDIGNTNIEEPEPNTVV